MLQRGAASQRRLLYDLPLRVREHIKKDGAVRSVLFCVLISCRCARMASGSVFLSCAVSVSRLTAPPLLWQSFIPLVRCFPIPQGLIAHTLLLRQLPQAYFLARRLAGDVCSLGGVARLAPLRHFTPPNSCAPRSAYGNTPRRNAGLRPAQDAPMAKPAAFPPRALFHAMILSRKTCGSC